MLGLSIGNGITSHILCVLFYKKIPRQNARKIHLYVTRKKNDDFSNHLLGKSALLWCIVSVYRAPVLLCRHTSPLTKTFNNNYYYYSSIASSTLKMRRQLLYGFSYIFTSFSSGEKN